MLYSGVLLDESDLFPSICTDCYSAVFDLVTHLIEVHGCKDIAYLSGKKWHKHSKERLQAYRDAMAKAGLEVPESRIIYGDFWYQSGEICAEELLADGKKLPDAVACENDQMAIHKLFLCNRIKIKKGRFRPSQLHFEYYPKILWFAAIATSGRYLKFWNAKV